MKRSVAVWKIRKAPKSASSAPGTKAVTLFLSGDPGTPKTLPNAREPSARLKDVGATSTSASSMPLSSTRACGGVARRAAAARKGLRGAVATKPWTDEAVAARHTRRNPCEGIVWKVVWPLHSECS